MLKQECQNITQFSASILENQSILSHKCTGIVSNNVVRKMQTAITPSAVYTQFIKYLLYSIWEFEGFEYCSTCCHTVSVKEYTKLKVRLNTKNKCVFKRKYSFDQGLWIPMHAYILKQAIDSSGQVTQHLG